MNDKARGQHDGAIQRAQLFRDVDELKASITSILTGCNILIECDERIGVRMDLVDDRMDILSQRIDTVNERVDIVNKRLRKLEEAK